MPLDRARSAWRKKVCCQEIVFKYVIINDKKGERGKSWNEMKMGVDINKSVVSNWNCCTAQHFVYIWRKKKLIPVPVTSAVNWQTHFNAPVIGIYEILWISFLIRVTENRAYILTETMNAYKRLPLMCGNVFQQQARTVVHTCTHHTQMTNTNIICELIGFLEKIRGVL